MLVDVRQLVEMPKGVRLWRVPSKVGLATSDLSSVVREQAVKTPDGISLGVPVRLTPIFMTVVKDRKRNLSHVFPVVLRFVRWAGSDGELPRNVIETGTEVVGDVSDQEAPSRRASFSLDVPDVLAKLRVVLVQDSVRVFIDESVNFFVEAIDVFACPIELELSAV